MFIVHRSSFIVFLALFACAKHPSIVVGSKNFTESVILGELVAQKLESAARCPVSCSAGGWYRPAPKLPDAARKPSASA